MTGETSEEEPKHQTMLVFLEPQRLCIVGAKTRGRQVRLVGMLARANKAEGDGGCG